MSLSALPTALVVPPINLLVTAAAGIGLAWWAGRGERRCWGQAGLGLAALSLLGLILLAMPIVASSMMLPLEKNAPPAGAAPPRAIVILSAEANEVLDESGLEKPGQRKVGPEGAGRSYVTVGQLTLERLRTGAALTRREGLPVLVSGGILDTDWPSIASLMAQSLEADFSIPVRWQEGLSKDTWENAQESAAILRREGISSVWVVTHAWHMRRALIAFRRAGLQAWPAPVPRSPPLRLTGNGFVPQASAWLRSYYALHEWIGCAWYALRG